MLAVASVFFAAAVTISNVDGYSINEMKHEMIQKFKDWEVELGIPFLDIISRQEQIIHKQEQFIHKQEQSIRNMERKMTRLTDTVNQQSTILLDFETQVAEMKRTIEKHDNDFNTMEYEKNALNRTVISLGERITYTESELHKQIEISNKLQIKIDSLVIKFENAYEDDNVGSVLEDRALIRSTNSTTQRQTLFLLNNTDVTASKRLLSSRSLSAQTGVAFSAYLSKPVEHMGVGHTIKPDGIYINDGNAYNSYTGTFTVSESGVYLLTFTVSCWHASHAAEVELVVDNVSMGSAKANTANNGYTAMATKTLILRLSAGQSVWLQAFYVSDGDISSDIRNKFTTFSGVLLY